MDSARCEPIVLTESQISQYNDRGYFVLRGYFTEAELAALRPSVPAASAVVDDSDAPSSRALAAAFEKCIIFGCPRTGEDPTKINKLEGLGRLPDTPRTAQLVSLFRRVGCEPGLAAIARQLLGSAAELMKDKYIFKGRGGGDGFPPHQDMNFVYSRVARDAVNFGVAFDAADEANGALEVCTEAYDALAGRLARTPLEVASTFESSAHLRFEHVRTAPGDVVVFSAWLLHRSTRNEAFARDRNVYYTTYGLPGYRAGVLGASGRLYADYYELHEAWIAAGFPFGDDVTALLGPGKPRPSLVPAHCIGVGWPAAAAGRLALAGGDTAAPAESGRDAAR